MAFNDIEGFTNIIILLINPQFNHLKWLIVSIGYICGMNPFLESILNLQFIDGFIDAYYQQLGQGDGQREAYEKVE